MSREGPSVLVYTGQAHSLLIKQDGYFTQFAWERLLLSRPYLEASCVYYLTYFFIPSFYLLLWMEIAKFDFYCHCEPRIAMMNLALRRCKDAAIPHMQIFRINLVT